MIFLEHFIFFGLSSSAVCSDKMPETASRQTTEAELGSVRHRHSAYGRDRQGGGVCVSGLGAWFGGVVVCVIPLDTSVVTWLCLN